MTCSLPSIPLRLHNFLPLLALLFAQTSLLGGSQSVLDLSERADGEVEGALFYRATSSPTPVRIRPFLEFKAEKSRASGFNTSARPTMSSVDGSNTRELQLLDVPVVTIGSSDYRQFLLDAKQVGNERYVTLLQLSLFTRDGRFDDADFEGKGDSEKYKQLVQDAELRWNLDNAQVVVDSGVNAFNDRGDAFVLIPSEAFSGLSSETYVYLYSTFDRGAATPSTDQRGEQWAVIDTSPRENSELLGLARTAPPRLDSSDPVPVPELNSTLALLGFASLLTSFLWEWLSRKSLKLKHHGS